MSSLSKLAARLAGAFVAVGCATGGGAPVAPEGLQERVTRLESEIEAIKNAPPAAPAAPTTAAAPPPAAESKPAEQSLLVWHVTPDITFKPGLRLQTRYEYNAETNNNDISIARFRLKAGGEVYEIANYYLEMKIDGTGRSGSSPTAAVENGWIDFAYSNALVGRAGLYDVPFSRDALTSDSKLLLVDRSLIKDALTSFGFADNGIGVMARGRPFDGRFEYAVGAFNNDKFDGFRTSSSKQSNALMPMARVAVDLLDPAPPFGYADYRASYIGKGQRLTIGTNGGWLGNAENGPTQDFDIFAWGADLFFNSGPWTLQAEYDWFRLTGNVDQSNHGWYVQGGYLLEALNHGLDEVAPWFPDLEVAARYQQLDARSYRSTNEKQPGVGMNFYIHEHNLKIQTDYLFRLYEHASNHGLYQLQLQLDF